jgi:hypothetical protein
VEDIAKGYGVDALIIHRPEITLERVVAHARDVYPSLRKAAAQRSAPLCRPREDGEAFDPAVHIWDVGATRLDWVEKYEAAYGGAPPRIERYSDKVKAQEALEERERLSGAAIRDKRAKLYFIGEREACTRGCGAMVWPGEASLCCRGGKHILGPAFNPPIDETYLTIAKKPGFSADSRRLNDKLALVHIWDVGATRLDWVEKYEAAYGVAPPRIERYSDKVKAQEALEERERRGDAEQARQAVLHWRAGGVRARLRRNGFARRGFAMLPRPRI